MSARWQKGIWLGKRFATEEHIVGTESGVVLRSGAVKAHPETQFDSSLFDGILGSPWDPLGEDDQKSPEEAKERTADLPRVVIPRGVDSAVPLVR